MPTISETVAGRDVFQPIPTIGKTLSTEQLERFNEDGYIIIPGLLSDDEVKKIKALQARAEAMAQEHGESFNIDGAHYDVEPLPPGHPEGKTVALRKIQEVFTSEPAFAEVMASKKLLDVVADLIGDEIYYHSSKYMCKPAFGGRRKPWHQDWAYWSDMNSKQVTVWCAIDKATTENGCMQIIPGSHKKGLVEHYHGEDFMIHEEGITEENIVIAEMNPGDALIFNVLALHASDPNNSSKDRLSAIIDFDSEPPPESRRTPYGSYDPLPR